MSGWRNGRESAINEKRPGGKGRGASVTVNWLDGQAKEKSDRPLLPDPSGLSKRDALMAHLYALPAELAQPVARVAPEDKLATSIAEAMNGGILLRHGEVFAAWDHSNARSAIEGARKKRLGAVTGWPDCAVWFPGGVQLFELKRSRYGALSAAQREVHARLAAIGHPVAVVHSLPEVLAVLRARGVHIYGAVAA